MILMCKRAALLGIYTAVDLFCTPLSLKELFKAPSVVGTERGVRPSTSLQQVLLPIGKSFAGIRQACLCTITPTDQ